MNKELMIAEKAGQIADVATRKSVSEADIMLMDTAEKGDAFALEVFKKLPHDVKAKIVNEGDFTKPTFSGLLATPEEVVNIFISDPSIWMEMGYKDIDERITQIRTMCTSLILSHDDSDKWFRALFQAIEEDESAVLYLAAAFVGCVEQDVANEEFHFSFTKSQYGYGEISHVHQMLSIHAPNLERQVAKTVCGFGDNSNSVTIAMLVELQEQSKAQAMVETLEAEGVDL